jgi:F0F1-type ATP synthase assembly protein I
MADKGKLYKRIKIAGLISFIPIILAVSPLGGYFLGEYLQNKFGLGLHAILIFTSLGFLAAIFEIVRIIRLVIRIEKVTDG